MMYAKLNYIIIYISIYMKKLMLTAFVNQNRFPSLKNNDA